METFTDIKEFVDNPDFNTQRKIALSGLDIELIDKPIRRLIEAFAGLPYCFTLQSCWGHFTYPGNKSPNNLDPLPDKRIPEDIEYRIAYVCFCIQDCPEGRRLFEDLSQVPEADRDYIQFGSAGWFWERQVNTYTLQVEPVRFSVRDTTKVSCEEALHIEKVRNLFFQNLENITKRLGQGL